MRSGKTLSFSRQPSRSSVERFSKVSLFTREAVSLALCLNKNSVYKLQKATVCTYSVVQSKFKDTEKPQAISASYVLIFEEMAVAMVNGTKTNYPRNTQFQTIGRYSRRAYTMKDGVNHCFTTLSYSVLSTKPEDEEMNGQVDDAEEVLPISSNPAAREIQKVGSQSKSPRSSWWKVVDALSDNLQVSDSPLNLGRFHYPQLAQVGDAHGHTQMREQVLRFSGSREGVGVVAEYSPQTINRMLVRIPVSSKQALNIQVDGSDSS
ncbi:hypothetical protein CLU79DRAFT_840168 [Phycomyces nitens]|nr:hypothetical protein CLU79DRAFT_840168 [Phycomyces nitens]